MQITDPTQIRKHAMVPVVYANRCLGFVFNRCGSFEAFRIDEQSLGNFASELDALIAIFNHKHAGAS